MTQLQEPGAAPATSTRAVSGTRLLCCPTVRPWSPEDAIISLPHFLASPTVRSSMTQLQERGAAPPTSTPSVAVTPPPFSANGQVLVAGGVTTDYILLDQRRTL